MAFVLANARKQASSRIVIGRHRLSEPPKPPPAPPARVISRNVTKLTHEDVLFWLSGLNADIEQTCAAITHYSARCTDFLLEVLGEVVALPPQAELPAHAADPWRERCAKIIRHGLVALRQSEGRNMRGPPRMFPNASEFVGRRWMTPFRYGPGGSEVDLQDVWVAIRDFQTDLRSYHQAAVHTRYRVIERVVEGFKVLG